MSEFIFDLQRFKYIENTTHETLLTGTSSADSIYNSGNSVTIKGGKGNDTLWNDYGDYVKILGEGGEDYIKSGSSNGGFYGQKVSIYGGSGNDTVLNVSGADTVIVDGGSDNDYIKNEGAYVTINGGAGNDTIISGFSASINGGTGNDLIELNNLSGSFPGTKNVDGKGNTVVGGKGNDTIYGNSEGYSNFGVIYKFSSGDGKDIIFGYTSYDKLSISGGSYSTTKSGDNIIVTVDDGKISLMGAASLSTVNIKFKKTSTETNSWKLDGTTATYGTASKTLITVEGVKSLDGLSLNKKVVTVAKASLGTSKVTISGDGYTLALADDVTAPKTTKAWSLKDTTATYNQTTSAGYTLADNAITYSKKSTKALFKISGVKSTSGLSVSGKVVTVKKASLGASKVTISGDGYTLKLGSDVSAPATKKAAFSLKGSTATYKSSYKTAGYTLASNSKSISYSKATTASSLATIKGAKSTSGLSVSGKKITLKNSALKNKVTVSGGYEFNFASDYKQATITGSAKADTITANGSKLSINGGKGDDTIKIFGSSNTVTGGKGSDVFVFKAGTSGVITDYKAEDKISIESGAAKITASGSDLIFTVGSGKITVTGGKNKTISYIDSGGEKTYTYSDSANIKYSKDKTAATLLGTYRADEFNFSEGLQSLDASKVTHDLTIIGNKEANSIVGSSQEDTIDGGAGADIIRGGKGNDSLYGGKGNDELYGGEDSDTLWGGAGNDELYGGDGEDVFIYNPGEGKDRIYDYDPNFDTIKLLSGNVDNVEPAGTDVVFTIGDGKIILDNAASSYAKIVDGSNKTLKEYLPKLKS